jgi:hypothetical protein
MAKKLIIFVIIIAVLGAASYFIFSKITQNQRKKIASLEQKISALQNENVPLRFKILEKTDDNMKIAVKFFDSKGNDIKRMVYDIKGNELQFDFIVIKLKDKESNLVFPYKIYSDKIAPDNGIKLAESYTVNGFPQIFFNGDSYPDSELDSFFIEIFDKILKDKITAEDDYFGSMVHDIPEYRSFKTNTVYKIVTRIKGGIEVIEE